MDHVHVIRHKVMVEGRSQRSVADELGLSRNTVKKYLSQSEPRYRTRQPREQPVLERVKPRLLELLADWEGRTTEKQCITAARLHSQLQEGGFEVGATTVRKFFREWRRQRAETFVPLVHRPGDEAQVDFFEVMVEVKRTRRKCWMFLMRLMHGGGDFTWLYERCDQVAFLDGHVRAFEFFCGAPARCVYDNLSAAVRKILFPGRN
ncbi:MAG: IS21 family transposase [Polyangiaceae bacterium]